MTGPGWGELPVWLQGAIAVFILVQITVEVAALISLWRTPVARLHFGKKWPWVLIIVFVNLIGAIVYFAAGRKPAPAADPFADAAAADASGRAARAAAVLYGAEPIRPEGAADDPEIGVDGTGAGELP